VHRSSPPRVLRWRHVRRPERRKCHRRRLQNASHGSRASKETGRADADGGAKRGRTATASGHAGRRRASGDTRGGCSAPPRRPHHRLRPHEGRRAAPRPHRPQLPSASPACGGGRSVASVLGTPSAPLRGSVDTIVHSDRGSQFRSHAYARTLRQAQLRGSMGRVAAGSPPRSWVPTPPVTAERTTHGGLVTARNGRNVVQPGRGGPSSRLRAARVSRWRCGGGPGVPAPDEPPPADQGGHRVRLLR
jgi:hypothetical protein